MARQIAFYGKGGIGKSTVVANVTASLAAMGHRVLQVGCDPKGDSSRTLLGGKSQVAVLDLLRATGPGRRQKRPIAVEDMVQTGFLGVETIESGGPEPGFGCAGRGITMTMEAMTKLGVFARGHDFVFYDVLGDVVCGGFAVPIRDSYAEEVYLVVSGEFMALYAANAICKGVARFAERGRTRIAGIVANERQVRGEREIVEAFADRVGTRLVELIPRDPVVQAAENAKKTVVEHAPSSPMAAVYRGLARKVAGPATLVLPRPLSNEELEALFLETHDRAEASASRTSSAPRPARPVPPPARREKSPRRPRPGGARRPFVPARVAEEAPAAQGERRGPEHPAAIAWGLAKPP